MYEELLETFDKDLTVENCCQTFVDNFAGSFGFSLTLESDSCTAFVTDLVKDISNYDGREVGNQKLSTFEFVYTLTEDDLIYPRTICEN